MTKDPSKIPRGDYCYTWLTQPSAENNYRGKVERCSFYQIKEVEGVRFPWCNFLNKGGYPGDGQWTGWENFEKAEETLKKHLGEDIEEKMSLFLLFDSCKECGENIE